MITLLEVIIYVLLFILIGTNILSFVASNFTDSIIVKVNNWCLSRLEFYESQNKSRFSITGIKKIVVNLLILLFTKVNNNINNPKLKNGIKLFLTIIMLLLLLAMLSLLLVLSAFIGAALLGLLAGLIILYLMCKLFELYYRHEKGLPLFSDTNEEHIPNSSIFRGKWNKVAEVDVNWMDKLHGDHDKKTFKDSDGKVVGTMSTSFWDELHGDHDKKTFKDSDGKVVGTMGTSFWDELHGDHDKKTFKDSDGKVVGTMGTSFWDELHGDHDKKTFKDSDGKVVGTMSTGFWDQIEGNYDHKIIKRH